MGIESTVKWFDIILNAANPKEADVYIYGVVGGDWNGDGTTADAFRKELDELGDVEVLNVHINSPGGSVYEGLAIYNILLRKRRDGMTVNIMIDALAASIATVIAMAGEKVSIPENATFMIHDPTMPCYGGEKDMQKAITRLKIAKNNIINAYLNKTSLPREEIDAMMSEETWMQGRQAVEFGFADTLEKTVEMAAVATEYGEEIKNHYLNPPKDLTGTSGKAESKDSVEDNQEIPEMAEMDEKKFAEMIASAVQAQNEANQKQFQSELNKFKKDAIKKEMDKFVAAGKMKPAERDNWVQIAEAMGDNTVKDKDGNEINAVDMLQNVLDDMLKPHGLLNEHAGVPIAGKETKEASEFKLDENDIPRNVNERSFVISKFAGHLQSQDKSLKLRDALYAAEKAAEEEGSELNKLLEKIGV